MARKEDAGRTTKLGYDSCDAVTGTVCLLDPQILSESVLLVYYYHLRSCEIYHVDELCKILFNWCLCVHVLCQTAWLYKGPGLCARTVVLQLYFVSSNLQKLKLPYYHMCDSVKSPDFKPPNRTRSCLLHVCHDPRILLISDQRQTTKSSSIGHGLGKLASLVTTLYFSECGAVSFCFKMHWSDIHPGAERANVSLDS